MYLTKFGGDGLFNLKIITMNSNTDKIIYFDQAIRQKRNISTFHFNGVFCEFSDLFYEGKSYKTTMTSFKKLMQYAAHKHNLKIFKSKLNPIDRHDYGIRVIWTLVY